MKQEVVNFARSAGAVRRTKRCKLEVMRKKLAFGLFK